MDRCNAALAVVALFAVVVATVHAHEGHLHVWPGTPSGSNYMRVAVATCDKWVKPTAVSKLVSANASVNAKPFAPASVKGNLTIWMYLYKNCTDYGVTAGGEVFVQMLTANNTLATGGFVEGYAQTETCAAGGGGKYYLNMSATVMDDDANLLWFKPFAVPANGTIRGIGSNDGPVNTTGDNAVRSFLLYDSNATIPTPFACCDLTVSDPAVKNWTAQLDGMGKFCDLEKAANTSSNATMMNATATAAPAAATGATAEKKSSAAVAGVAAAAVLANALLVLLL